MQHNRWGTEDGTRGKLKEYDLLWDSTHQVICVARRCAKCRRLIVLRWQYRIASKKSNLVCARCGKG